MSTLHTRILALCTVGMTAACWTLPAWGNGTCVTEFQALYGSGPGTTYDSAGCQTCHTSVPALNGYGADLGACTAAAIGNAEGLDSDTADGSPSVGGDNLTEINAGAQPGWCVATTPGCENAIDPPAGITGLLDPVADNTPPQAVAGGPYEGEAGTPVQFDGSASSDADGDALSYAWNFGDGNSASGPNPLHTYAAAGVYTVELVVDDGITLSAPASTTANILEPIVNVPPVADAGGPYSGATGAAIQFDGSASADPNGDLLTYAWDFGDGSSADGAAPSHGYSAAGTYTVTLVVNDGQSDSTPDTVTAEIFDSAAPADGQALYDANCLGCHGDPWEAPVYDDGLPGKRRVAGARTCSIRGSIFGTSVYPGGVPGMEFLQGVLTDADMEAIDGYLNSREASGEQRYAAACAGCHGADGSGGATGEDVHGDEEGETAEAIREEDEMRFLECLPESDVAAISDYLAGFDDDADDDGIPDDEDPDDDNDGIRDEDDPDDDNDGLDDDDERDYGTDPRNHDSDDDDVDDGREVEDGTDPTDADTDDDDLNDGEEIEFGTDALDPDTDDDGFSDGLEVKVMGTDPLEKTSADDGSSGGGGGATGLWLLLGLATAKILLPRRCGARRRR